MTAKLESLKQELAQLPIRDRAFLADFLLDSIDAVEDGAWEEAWQSELNQRLAEVDQGIILGEPNQQVIQDLKEKC
jgi:putative addiction module component (TIGR02574 family)